VGKTSLITRFMYDSFDNTYQVRNTCELMYVSVWKLESLFIAGELMVSEIN